MKPPEVKGYEYKLTEVKKSLRKKNILVLLVAYNDNCNLKCPFCFTKQGKRGAEQLKKAKEKVPELLTKEEIKKMIDDAAKLGIKSVCFYGEGEPLLNKSLFFELVDYVNKKELTPVLFTNGTLVDKKTAKMLFENNVSVIGKLYSFNLKTNEFLTGNKGQYEYIKINGTSVPTHIKNLLEAGYAGSRRFALHTVITNKNLREIPKIWEFERKLKIIPYMDFLYLPNKLALNLDITEKQREELHKKIWKLDKKLGYEYALSYGPHLGHRTCDTRAALFVGANGIARVCASTYLFLGDIRTKTLPEILEKKWETEKKIGRGCNPECVYCDCYRYIEKTKDSFVA